MDLLDRAGDARTQLDVVGRLEAAAELLAVDDGALHRGRDADRRCLRRPALRVGIAAAAGQRERAERAERRDEGDAAPTRTRDGEGGDEKSTSGRTAERC